MLNKNYYVNIFFFILFILCFNEPIIRTSLTLCENTRNNLSLFNELIEKNRFFLKVILAIYIIHNISFIKNVIDKLKFIYFYYALLFIFSLILNDIKQNLIIFLNSFLFLNLIIVFYLKFNQKNLFKLIYIYLLIIISLSSLEIIFNLSDYYIVCEINFTKLNIAGFTLNKNQLGLFIFLFNFLHFFVFNQTNKKFINFSLILYSIIFLIYIDSITSLFITLLLYSIFFLKKKKESFFIFIFVLLLFIFYFNSDFLLDLVGRDQTLTGRINVWFDIDIRNNLNFLFGNGLGKSKFTLVDNAYLISLYELGLILTIIYFIWIFVNSNFIFDRINIIFFTSLVYSITEGGTLIYSNTFYVLILISIYLKKKLFYLNEKNSSFNNKF